MFQDSWDIRDSRNKEGSEILFWGGGPIKSYDVCA